MTTRPTPPGPVPLVGDGLTPGRRPGRRTVIQVSVWALGAAAVSACTGSDESGPDRRTTGGTPVPEPSADLGLVADAIADEQALLHFCRDAAQRHQRLRPVIAPVEAAQRRHVTQLRRVLTDPPKPRQVRPRQVPRRADDTVRSLVRLASAASDRRGDDCLSAESGLLARLLASVAASHAVTVETLRGRQ